MSGWAMCRKTSCGPVLSGEKGPPQSAAWLLLAVPMLAPLAFGAVLPWAWAAMTMLIVLACLVWALRCACSRRLTLVGSPLLLPLIVLSGIAGVQLLAGLTMDAVATREAVIKLLSCTLLFFLALQLFAPAGERWWRRSAAAITIYAFALALFAIVQFFASPGLLYGVVKPRWGGYVFGPYVNHNNYAGLMELLVPVTAGLVFALPLRHAAKPATLFALLTCVVSTLLSGSRGGVAALLAEFVIFTAVIFRAAPAAEQRNRTLLAGLALVLVAGAAFFWLDPGGVWQRWRQLADARELTAGDRLRMSADGLRMARACPALGVGLGAFATAYPRYQSVVTDEVIDYAHNDYVQLAAEGGLPAALVTLAALPLFFCLAFRRLRSRLQQPRGWLQLGAAVGVCGILLHSLVDFNLHIPANAAWFAFSAAWAVAPGRKRQR